MTSTARGTAEIIVIGAREARGQTPRRLLRAGIVVLLVGVVGAGVASAYWTASGGGAGSATTRTAVAVTLSLGTPTASLYPGGQANVVLSVSNPNAASVFVASLALDVSGGTGGLAVDTGHSGCALATLSFTTQTNAGAGWTVPAESGGVDGTLPVTLTNALSMDVSAANACQGASFTVYLAAGP